MLYNPLEIPAPVVNVPEQLSHSGSVFSRSEVGNTALILNGIANQIGMVIHNTSVFDLYVLLESREGTGGAPLIAIDTTENYSFKIAAGGSYFSNPPGYSGRLQLIFDSNDVTGTNKETVNLTRFTK